MNNLQKLTAFNQTLLENVGLFNEKDLVKKFTNFTCQLLEADFAFCWYKEKTDRKFKWFYKTVSTPYTPTQPRPKGVMATTLKAKHPRFIADVKKYNLVRADAKHHMASVIVIPLIFKNYLYGDLVICFKNKRSFLVDHKQNSALIGKMMAQAITINRLYSQLENFQRSLNQTSDTIILFSPKNLRISYANSGAENKTGLSSAQLRGKHMGVLIHDSHKKKFYVMLRNILSRKYNSCIFETALKSRRGKLVAAEMLLQYVKSRQQPAQLLAIVRDLSERKRSQSELKKAVLRDSLTGLPNRILLNERLRLLEERSRRNKEQFAVVFIDLDQFKFVNDTLGHVSGDMLLKQVALRLRGSVKKEDLVFRLGGDEFVILLQRIKEFGDIEKVAERISENFKDPFNLSGQEVYVNVSMGISKYPKDGTSSETLLKNADNALYRAKLRGGSTYEYYFPEIKLSKFANFELDRELRAAVKRADFEFYFQPIYRLSNPVKVAGLEALLRWNHKELGVILPDNFIQHLEDSGLISMLTQWQFEKICQTLQALGSAALPVSLNFSARQLLQQGIFDKIKDTLKKYNIKPSLINLEITESLLIKNLETSRELFEQLRDLGLEVVIDDFGTGYASLSYLKQLPVDALKIDQSFIQNMLVNPTDLGIIKAILNLGKDLNIKVVAEGVETAEQHKKLVALGGLWGQGNWYSPPLKLDELAGKIS